MATDTAPIETDPLPTLEVHRSLRWVSAVLALLILLIVTVTIFAAWYPLLPKQDRAVETYLPLRAGTTLYYRLTNPDRTEQFQTTNVGRLSGEDGLAVLPVRTRLETVAYLLGKASDDFSADEYNDFVTLANRDVQIARVIETTTTTTATVSTASSYYLVQDHRVVLLAIDTQGFSPLLPFYDDQMVIGDSLTVTGTYGVSSLYSATLTYEGNEDIDTSVGALPQCRKMRLVLDITDVTRNSVMSWFCDGVGVAYQETTVNENAPIVSTLLALHTPSTNGGPVTTPPLDATQQILSNADMVPLTDDDAWQTEWSYYNRGQQSDFSTSVVATRDYLLVGTEAGYLFALNRHDHSLAWRFQTGDSIYAAPTVADGVVYIASRDGTLYAVDLVTGAYRWSFVTKDALTGSPTVADGVVYFGSEDHFIYALSTDGSERWHYETAGAVASTPVVQNGVLYIGSDDGGLYALDSQSGVTRWVFPADTAPGEAVAVVGDVVVVGTYGGDVYALKRDTPLPEGEVVWSFRADQGISFAIKVVDQQAFAVSTNTIYALDIHTGVLAWKYSVGELMHGSPLIAGETLIENLGQRLIVLNRMTGALIDTIPAGDPDAYNAVTTDGKELFLAHSDGFLRVLSNDPSIPWEFTPTWTNYDLANTLIAASDDDLGSPPVRYQDDLVFVTTYGRIVRANRDDGRYIVLGQVPIDLAYMPPAIQGNTVLVRSQTGELALFNLQSHETVWQKDLAQPTYYPAQFAGDRVLWATSAGGILTAYAFDVATGETLWQKDFPFALGVSNGSVLYQGVYYVIGDVLTALDPQTGDLLWQTTDDLNPLHIAAMDDTIYVMGLTSDYQTVIAGWNISTHERTTWIPYSADVLPVFLGEGFTAGGGNVFVVLSDNTLLAFSVAEQELAWHVKNEFSTLGAPRVYADKVWYVTTANHLSARYLRDGTFAGDFALQDLNVNPTGGTMAPLFDEGALYVGFYQTAIALPLREEP